MSKLNAIILSGKVYEAIDGDCSSCDFDKDVLICRRFNTNCHELMCAFRFSQELTDKLNKE